MAATRLVVNVQDFGSCLTVAFVLLVIDAIRFRTSCARNIKLVRCFINLRVVPAVYMALQFADRKTIGLRLRGETVEILDRRDLVGSGRQQRRSAPLMSAMILSRTRGAIFASQ